jgi:aryl-alcohol dehydrogenase-like predicted oxidoreductase
MYSEGESERVLGNVLADYDRDSQVVATKGYFQMDDDNPNSGGASRKAIEQELSNSLDRLGMDTVDLYQTHRWDDDTPIETTLRALSDAVRRGQARHVGTSSMWAHQFAEALRTSEREGLERFETMQNHYNLLYREEEREMLPLCDREDVGVLPWSPLARGYLTRPHEQFDATTRGQTDDYAREHPYFEGGGEEVNERVAELADEKGVSMAQISLAWLLHQDVVDAPIVGTTSVEHLEAAVEALEIDLSSSEQAYLEEPYEPVPVSGHD